MGSSTRRGAPPRVRLLYHGRDVGDRLENMLKARSRLDVVELDI